MKKFLCIVTIFGSVFGGLILLSGVLAAPGAPQPLSSPAAAQAECDCSHLKALQIELRNATRLQQAFRNKIPELRAMEMENRASMAELERWAKSDAPSGIEQAPGSSGPAHVDYKPWGDRLKYQDDERVTSAFKNEALCRRSDESAAALEEAKKASACAGIAQALEVHEDWHLNFCLRIGYRPYWLGMRGADRAQEEVEAYGAQIAVLRAEIARVLNLKECKRYKATGIYGGVVCSLEKPFTLTMSHASGFQGHPQFTPDNSQGGSLTDNPVIGGVQWEDRGRYTVEEKSWGPDIVMRGTRCTELPTGRFCTPYTNLRIALLPLDTDECNK